MALGTGENLDEKISRLKQLEGDLKDKSGTLHMENYTDETTHISCLLSTSVGFIGIFLSLASYRLERLAIWRNPELYEKGYQTMQGLYAIGSGGLFCMLSPNPTPKSPPEPIA